MVKTNALKGLRSQGDKKRDEADTVTQKGDKKGDKAAQ